MHFSLEKFGTVAHTRDTVRPTVQNPLPRVTGLLTVDAPTRHA